MIRSPEPQWRSPMSLASLKRRAELLASLRGFFASRQVLEVDVPVMGSRTVTDPYIQAISSQCESRNYFLQTSPEYFMKRLLAGGAPSMYYLGKAFRRDECGRNHNPEFTMLEWYRLDFDDQQLMTELTELLTHLDADAQVSKVSYASLFYQHFGCDPHRASTAQLAELAQQGIDVSLQGLDLEDRNLWLDLLFSHLIEPTLQAPTIVFDYPASQCALAKVAHDQQGRLVAKRFELFWQGLELANAYWELSDPVIQRQRFTQDIECRKRAGLPVPELDQKFLAAIEAGLPECAGIALGVDRLFMCLEKLPSIAAAVTFSDSTL